MIVEDNNIKANQANLDYTSGDIQVLEGLTAVRKRPGMYIGSTDLRGLHQCVYEVIDNSIDEALAGFCTHVELEIFPNNIIKVHDNGRGIPIDLHPKFNKPALEIVLTKLHAGGKFQKSSYKISGGLHGVGVSCVNALAQYMNVTVHRDGKTYFIELKQGKVVTPMKEIGTTDKTGTTVEFKADDTIFETIEPNFDILSKRLRELAFLNKGIEIKVVDRRGGEEKINLFKFEGGIKSFVQHLNQNKKSILEEPLYILEKKDDIIVEISFSYNESFSEILYTYVNNIHTHEGGTHLNGFKTGLTRVFNQYLKTYELDKKNKYTITSDDTREGIVGVLSIKMPDPQFEGQTKSKLSNTFINGVVREIVGEKLSDFFDANPSIGKQIIEKSIQASLAREAAKRAREMSRKKADLYNDSLPGKLSDCSSRNRDENEIYLVEGDSAGGSAKQGRDRNFQAVLALRGKMLNVEKTRLAKIIGNEKLQPIISALGAGFGDDFNVAQLRYGKIIIMADADVDGSHIRTLLLTFFFRYMRELVDKGYVYVAIPPLYKIYHNKKEFYAFDEEQREKIIANNFNKVEPQLQRYKGLGEMNPGQLWETTMDPATRIMIRLNADDFIEADRIFSILMGDDVLPRKEFIYANSKSVSNLDV